MHILIVSCGYPNTYQPLEGIFYRDQAEALAANGFKVGVVSTVPVSLKDILRTRKYSLGRKKFIENGIPTYLKLHISIPGKPEISTRKCEKYGIKLFREYIAENGMPDLVHLHCFEGGELAQRIKANYGIPYVITEHSSRFLMNTNPASMEPYAKTAFKEAAARIAVSDHLRSILSEKYAQPFQYIPNIAEQDIFFPDPTIEKNANFTFIHVAGLNENKNQEMLLRAFNRIKQQGTDAQLRIAGEGPKRADLELLINELQLSGEVTLLGQLPREELRKEFNASHCFVLSSKKETFGVVVIEAMSCGLPAVSTRCGGPESVITKPWLGELTEISEDALSLGLLKVFHNRGDYDAQKISEHARSHYSGEAVVEKLESVYSQISK